MFSIVHEQPCGDLLGVFTPQQIQEKCTIHNYKNVVFYLFTLWKTGNWDPGML